MNKDQILALYNRVKDLPKLDQWEKDYKRKGAGGAVVETMIKYGGWRVVLPEEGVTVVFSYERHRKHNGFVDCNCVEIVAFLNTHTHHWIEKVEAVAQ